MDWGPLRQETPTHPPSCKGPGVWGGSFGWKDRAPPFPRKGRRAQFPYPNLPWGRVSCHKWSKHSLIPRHTTDDVSQGWVSTLQRLIPDWHSFGKRHPFFAFGASQEQTAFVPLNPVCCSSWPSLVQTTWGHLLSPHVSMDVALCSVHAHSATNVKLYPWRFISFLMLCLTW